jgi:hypothetical protein
MNLRRALERCKRRERRASFAAEKRLLACDHALHAMLYHAGMRPSRQADGSILWEQPTMGVAN